MWLKDIPDARSFHSELDTLPASVITPVGVEMLFSAFNAARLALNFGAVNSFGQILRKSAENLKKVIRI